MLGDGGKSSRTAGRRRKGIREEEGVRVNVQTGNGWMDGVRNRSRPRISSIFPPLLFVSAPLLYCHLILWFFCSCWLSASPSLFLSITPSLPLSLSCWLQTVLNVGHPVWKLPSLCLSLSPSAFIQSTVFLPLLLLLWGCDFSGLGAGLLDSSPGWIPLYWIWFILHIESTERTQSQGPAASISWIKSGSSPSVHQRWHAGGG